MVMVRFTIALAISIDASIGIRAYTDACDTLRCRSTFPIKTHLIGGAWRTSTQTCVGEADAIDADRVDR